MLTTFYQFGIKHEYGVKISRPAILVLATLSVVAYQGGFLPDGNQYGYCAGMVVVLAGLVALGGAFQEGVVRVPVAELEEVHV